MQYRETSAAAVISDVASGTANLGVVRWQAEHAATLDNLLRENALSGEVLWEFSMVVLLHERHPLAALGDIPYHLLGDYPEIVHGDLRPCCRPSSRRAGEPLAAGAASPCGARRPVHLLRRVPGSYMWVSPVPFGGAGGGRSWCRSLPQRLALPRQCLCAAVQLQRGGVAFISELRREIAGLVQT
ncbi:MAG: hypothetical protein ACLVEX_01540 [Ruthenibacterium lactatiformans]